MSVMKKRGVAESADSEESDDDFGPKPIEGAIRNDAVPSSKRKRLQNELVHFI